MDIMDYYGEAHVMPGPFRDLEHVMAQNVVTGHHFFDRDTMRSFSSKLAPGLIGGRVFITSEQDRSPYLAYEDRAWSGQRRYTVRIAADDGSVQACGPLDDDSDTTHGYFSDLRSARKWAKLYAAGEARSAVASWVLHKCPEGETPKVVTCGNCGHSWCERCDPAPSALCHWCNGRGHSIAFVPPHQAAVKV